MNHSIFEEIIPPHGPIRYKVCGKLIPVGYKAAISGIQIRHNTRTYQGWKDITSALCVLSGLGEKAPDGSCLMVEITFQDALGILQQIWVETKEAFSPNISRILREQGAACTTSDGSRLADYFRACYDLRVEEARAAGRV